MMLLVISDDFQDLISLLLMLAGDVEANPGPGRMCVLYIGIGRCSDLGGRHFFFLNNKNVISLRNNAYMQYGLQYCNEVHYVNSG